MTRKRGRKVEAEKLEKLQVARCVLQYWPRAIREIAKVSMFGNSKYENEPEQRGFSTFSPHTFDDAMIRHYLDLCTEGPVNTKDGGVLHRAQIAWNALSALETYLEAWEKDNG